MNARQARRMAMWLNGRYLLSADSLGLTDGDVAATPSADIDRLQRAQESLGRDLIERSGIDEDATPAEAIASMRSEPTAKGRKVR